MGITQGDNYAIAFTIKDDEGKVIDNSVLSAVQITIGEITKFYPDAITFEDGKFLFPLTQEESLELTDRPVSPQVRIKFFNGDIVTENCKATVINQLYDKEVI